MGRIYLVVGQDRISEELGMAKPHFEDMQIRRAGQADAADIRALTRSAYAKWVPLIGREPTPMGADYDRAVREHMIDLLVVGGRMVALIETVNEPDHLLIANVAVAPPFQGRGYGRYLLDHAERLATSLGLSELRLYTNQRMVTNIELYGRLGYAVDREEPFMGGVVVHMSKRLATSGFPTYTISRAEPAAIA
jgi:ribosomal protein S18 acetylase RimI-like enzyme